MNQVQAAGQGLNLDFAEGAASPAAWRIWDHDRRKVRGNLGAFIPIEGPCAGLKAVKMKILHGLLPGQFAMAKGQAGDLASAAGGNPA